jgi:cell division protein FtsB
MVLVTDGHRTSTIPRPPGARTPSRGGIRPVDPEVPYSPYDELDDRTGPLKDLTSPIAKAKRIARKGHSRLLVAIFATVIVGAIAAALFVLPVKSWLKQRDDLATRTTELETLNAANARLQAEVDNLQTDAGIAAAARQEIDYSPIGEKRVTALPASGASTNLPDGWPYNLVESIITLRAAEQAAAATTTAAATAGP